METQKKLVLLFAFFNGILSLYANPFTFDLRYPLERHRDSYLSTQWHSNLLYTEPSANRQLWLNKATFEYFAKEDSYELLLFIEKDFHRGQLFVEGYDPVFGNGSRELRYNSNTISFGSEINTPWFHGWAGYSNDTLLGGVELLGSFPLDIDLFLSSSKESLSYIEMDIFNRYTLDLDTLKDYSELRVSWRPSALTLELGMQWQRIYTDQGENLIPQEIKQIIDIRSEYSYAVNIMIPFTHSKALSLEYNIAQYSSKVFGSLDRIRFLGIQSMEADDFTFQIRNHDIDLKYCSDNSSMTLKIQYLDIPQGTSNISYIDFAPLSPVGDFYRRRDIIEDFSADFFHSSLEYAQIKEIGPWRTEWNILAGYMHWTFSGDYYYMEIIPDPITFLWRTTEYPTRNLEQSGWLAYLQPRAEVELEVGRALIALSLSQWIPITPLEELFNMDDLKIADTPSGGALIPAPISNNGEESSENGLQWGGLQFGIEIGMSL